MNKYNISHLLTHGRGFTLIELLIVIGILAILATVVVLVLNPAEILAQARDSQRKVGKRKVSESDGRRWRHPELS